MSILPKGKFHPKNVSKKLAKDGQKHCNHFWVNKGKTIIRNGMGDAIKSTKYKCVLCGETKKDEEKYVDNRIIYNEVNK